MATSGAFGAPAAAAAAAAAFFGDEPKDSERVILRPPPALLGVGVAAEEEAAGAAAGCCGCGVAAAGAGAGASGGPSAGFRSRVKERLLCSPRATRIYVSSGARRVFAAGQHAFAPQLRFALCVCEHTQLPRRFL